MSLPEDLTHSAAGGFRSLADGREVRVLADRYGFTAPGNGEVPGAFRHEWVTFIHSSLRSVPVKRQVYRQGAEHPLAYLGGPRDKPGAGRPRPPRGQARVAARLATPQPAGGLTRPAHCGDVDPSIDGSGGSRCESDAVPPL